MKQITNIQVLQYTRYYNTTYSIKIIKGIQLPETMKLSVNKIKLN